MNRTILVNFLVFIGCLFVINTNAQNLSNFSFVSSPEVLSRESFDLKFFNKNRGKNNFYSYNTVDLKGDSVKSTWSDASNYVEKIEYLNQPFAVEKNYDKRTLRLIKCTYYIHRSPYGEGYQFNPLGMLEKRTDYEKEFPFSWTSLAKLMKDKFNVDIFSQKYYDKDPLIVQRATNPSVYYVKFPRKNRTRIVEDGKRLDLIVVDGVTGEILEQPSALK